MQNLLTIPVEINGVTIRAVVDSGSTISLINPKWFTRLKLSPFDIKQNQPKVTFGGGSKKILYKQVVTDVGYNGIKSKTVLFTSGIPP